MQILCFFSFLFLFKGSSKCGFFHLAVLFRFYRVLFLHHVFLSEQIKMMMMICLRLHLYTFLYVKIIFLDFAHMKSDCDVFTAQAKLLTVLVR